MTLAAAFMADGYGIIYWLLILLSVVAGFIWLWQFVDHLNIRKCWQALLVCAVSGYLAHVVGGQADEYRKIATAAGTGMEPGDGLTLVFMLFLGVAFLVTPFFLLFSTRGAKKDGN